MSNSNLEEKEPPQAPQPQVGTQLPADWGESDVAEGKPPLRFEASEPLAYQKDQQFFRTALHYVGVVSLIAIVGALILAYLGKEIPQFVVAIGSGALGIFGVMFGASRR